METGGADGEMKRLPAFSSDMFPGRFSFLKDEKYNF